MGKSLLSEMKQMAADVKAENAFSELSLLESAKTKKATEQQYAQMLVLAQLIVNQVAARHRNRIYESKELERLITRAYSLSKYCLATLK